MDPPERVQRWLRIAAGRRLHLGLMGTLSFRPAAPWCKQPVLNWLALLPSLSPPFFISLAHFAYLSDSTWISLASLFPSASLSTILTCFCSFRLLLSPSVFLVFLFLSLPQLLSSFFLSYFFFSQYSVNKVCFMLLNNRVPNRADPWRPTVDALAVVSQLRTFWTFVKMLNLWEINGGGMDVRCNVAYSCGSITAVLHTVINDSHS